MKVAHFMISPRDDVLLFAHAVGLTYDIERMGFWEKMHLRRVLKKQRLAVRKMPKLVSLDRIAEHYGCVRGNKDETCKEEHLYVLDNWKEIRVSSDVSQELEKSRLSILTRGVGMYESTQKQDSDVFEADSAESNLYFCLETKTLWTETQVVDLISWFSRQKRSFDDWKYFVENY